MWHETSGSSRRIRPEQTTHDFRPPSNVFASGLRELSRLERTLVRLGDACAAREPTHECPVLEALEDDDEDLDIDAAVAVA